MSKSSAVANYLRVRCELCSSGVRKNPHVLSTSFYSFLVSREASGASFVALALAASEIPMQYMSGSPTLVDAEWIVSSILDAVGAMVVILDDCGRIVRFNSECERLTGYATEEMHGFTPWEMLLPMPEREFAREMFDRLLVEKRSVTSEANWRTKSGDCLLISWMHNVIQDAAGEVRYVIGTGIDTTERTRLERAVVEVSEEERSRIGHQLHEHLCNHLAGTALIAGALAEEARKGNDIDPDALDEVSHLVAEAVDQASALARGLVPVRIEKDGLLAALQEMTADVQRMTSIECEFTAETGFPELAHTSMANHLYRIAQEAVANALVHSQSTQITIAVTCRDDNLFLVVRDNGIGLADEPSPDGLGLHMMRYRARMMGGTLGIGSPDGGRGTEVRCTVPAPPRVASTAPCESGARYSTRARPTP